MTKKKSPIRKYLKLIVFLIILVTGFYGFVFARNDSRYISRNWTKYEFTKLGFSLKLPPDWSIFPESEDVSEMIVELRIVNDSNPMGQYYMDKVISGQGMIFGPQEIIVVSNKFAKPYQYLDSQKGLVHANFLFSGMLKENASFKIGNKIATFAESGSNSEIFIPISELEGRVFGLVLTTDSLEDKELLKQIAKTIEFSD